MRFILSEFRANYTVSTAFFHSVSSHQIDPSRPPFVLGEKGRRFLRLDAVGPPLDFGGIAIVKIEEPWRRSEKAEGKQRGSDYACENGILSHWINQRAFGDKAWDRDTLLKGYSLPATSPFRLSR